MSAVDVRIERETANDIEALVVAIHVASGSTVAADDLLFEIENSKATQETRAPVAGVFVHDLVLGQPVAFGVSVARILSAEAWAARAADPAPVEPAAAPSAPQEPDEPASSDIVLERETANDESGLVVAVHVASGQPVDAGQLLFDIENSKATQETTAPHAGVLHHALTVGETVGFGVPIATLSAGAAPAGAPQGTGRAEPPTPPPASEKPADPPVQATVPPPRFSKAAAELIARMSGSVADFPTGFVTADDVRTRLAPTPPVTPARPPAPTPSWPAGAVRGEPVSSRKRTEIEVLRQGAGESLLSVLGVTLGPLPIDRDTEPFLDGRVTDLVIYEAARLMRKFPKLNACYENERIVLHEAVHAGLAIDDGGRLVVYAIENADRATLADLAAAMGDGLVRYLDNTLTAREMSQATFTVTDLSAEGLDFILPLLPRGQSCIIGITRDEAHGFRLFAGFDHRVTEGREVGRFLRELKERLVSFASTAERRADPRRCLYCERTAEDAVATNKDKGLLRIVDRHGRDGFCCASCWQGW